MTTAFTPLSALAGGLLIGSAVVVLWLTLGRIAGVSGVIGATLRVDTPAGGRGWRIAFLLGLVAGPLVAMAVLGSPLVRPSPATLPVLLLAGLAVGAGTGMASGCTSGHGVCGVSRLSPRSLAATGVFMAFGLLSASLIRPLFGA